MEQLRSVFSKYKSKMPKTSEEIEKLNVRVTKIFSNWKSGALNKLAGMFNKDVEADILNAYEMVKNFDDIWPQLVQRYPEELSDVPLAQAPETEELSAEQKAKVQNAVGEIQNLLLKAVTPKYAAFRKPVIPPETFVEELMELSSDEITNLTQNISPPETQQVDPMDQAGVETQGTEGTTGTQGTQTTTPATGTASTTKSKPTQPGGSGGDAPAAVSQNDKEVISDLLKAAGKEEDQQAMTQAQGVINALRQAGYNISK